MPDLLLELRSEEIPARMQRKAAGDLRKLVTDGLVEAGLTYEGCQEYWTPRRLALDLRGLTARSKDVREEIKGPPVKAPEQAVQGFLRKAGLSSTDQLSVQTDPKKGDFYVAVVERPGRSAEEIIAGLMPGVIRGFPWPKSMRWGRASAPKGTRFYGDEAKGGETLRWVRPLQSILCTFGPETADPVVVDFTVDGIRSGNVTWGHRFHAPDAITVRRFDDYVSKLEAAKVVLDGERRKSIILDDARTLAFASGLELVEDEGLLEEVSGLVEWPVVLMGEFETEYLEIPPEVVRLTIRANQKCFVTRVLSSPLAGEVSAERTEGGGSASPSVQAAPPPPGPAGHPPRKGEGHSRLSNRFVLTANIEADDGGAEIARGNGKVVRARLSDALYFWKTDQSDLPDLGQLQASAEKFGLDLGKPLDQRMARLDHLGVTFHAKLGTQGERVERIARLAEELAPVVAKGMSPADGEAGGPPPLTPPLKGEGDWKALARRAAILAKADLQTEVVGEFPELQGAMGRKYAELQGEDASVAAAIEEHYRPQGPSDTVPTAPVSIAVALADKLDTLVGFWAIDEKPTGSKDPYALRRAALGVIRILVENGVRLGLSEKILRAYAAVLTTARDSEFEISIPDLRRGGFTSINVLLLGQEEEGASLDLSASIIRFQESSSTKRTWRSTSWTSASRNDLENISVFPSINELLADLLSFFHDRLKVYLRDQGARHDLIDAVLASGGGLISPLEGEMSAKPTEGGEATSRQAPPSALSGGASHGSRPSFGPPSRGEISQSQAAEATARSPGESDLLPQGEKEGRGGAAGASSPLAGGPEDGRDPRLAPKSAEQTEGGGSASPSAQAAPPPPGPAGHPPRKGEGSAANDDLLMIVRRVTALAELLDTEDGKNLLAGTKRAVNILAAEEKKATEIAPRVDSELFVTPEERQLFEAIGQADDEAAQAIRVEDFSAAMRAMARLRGPIDTFFETVLVNDPDEAIRANRLALLTRIRAVTGQVADFSRIAG